MQIFATGKIPLATDTKKTLSAVILKTLKDSAKAFPTASCNGCHAGAAADDWVFTQYYPVLRGGKGKGKGATGGMHSDLSMDN